MKVIKREDFVYSIQEAIREMSNMPEDEPLAENLRFYEDLGFTSLDYPDLASQIETKYHLDYEALSNCGDFPETIGALADVFLEKIQVPCVN